MGGLGPWMPYQMFGRAFVGMLVGLPPKATGCRTRFQARTRDASSRGATDAGEDENRVVGRRGGQQAREDAVRRCFQRACGSAQFGAQCLQADLKAPATCLDEAVGIQGKNRVPGEFDLDRPERTAADAERDSQDVVDGLHCAIRPEYQGRGWPALAMRAHPLFGS